VQAVADPVQAEQGLVQEAQADPVSYDPATHEQSVVEVLFKVVLQEVQVETVPEQVPQG